MNSPRNENITPSVISPYAKVYVRKNKRTVLRWEMRVAKIVERVA